MRTDRSGRQTVSVFVYGLYSEHWQIGLIGMDGEKFNLFNRLLEPVRIFGPRSGRLMATPFTPKT